VEDANVVSGLSYFTWRPAASPWFVDAVAGYGGLKLGATRAGDGTGDAAGARSGVEWMTSIETGYRVADRGRDFASYVRLDAAGASLRSFAESDSAGAGIRYQRQSVPSLKFAAGAEASSTFSSPFGTILPRGRIEFRHEIDRASTAGIGYLDDPGGGIYGTEIAGARLNALSLSLDARLALRDGWSVSSSYRVDHVGDARARRIDLRVERQGP
jgi:uncharacterized protein with beta-barrel porin domain